MRAGILVVAGLAGLILASYLELGPAVTVACWLVLLVGLGQSWINPTA